MKKKVVAYGLLDGRIIPWSTCSLRNVCSSSNSSCNSRMFLLIRVAGAPGFRLMVWSYNRFSGNFFDSWSSNTRACFRYYGGTKFFGSTFVVGILSTHPRMVCDIGLICRGRNRTFTVSGLRNTIGNWSWEIHPQAQSIFGWVAVNQGYPRMTLFSSKLERKYCSVRCVVPVLVCKSV